MSKEEYPVCDRKSVRIFAKAYGISSQIMNVILMKNGRLEGVPGNFRVTPEYEQYEHCLQYGDYGFSYDAPFFEGIEIDKEAIEEAKQWIKDYKDRKIKDATKEQIGTVVQEVIETVGEGEKYINKKLLVFLGGSVLVGGCIWYVRRKKIKEIGDQVEKDEEQNI